MLAAVELYKLLPDGSQWGQWQGYHVPVSPRCATVWTPAGTAMHWQPATWDAENHAIAYFWPGRWYVIHTFYTRGGVFAGCYCDIVLPNPTVAPAASDMRYTDLYVDVVVRADRSVFTKDQEVYDRAMLKHDALVAMHDEVFRELAALANHAEHWTGPFALISDHLARDDWHTLDPADPDFVAACADQWPIPFEQA